MAQVQILLSTWQGERWLSELLESLERQSWHDWELLVRDDDSNDATRQILQDWQYNHPSKIAYLEREHTHLGSKASFNRLVQLSTAPYLMFCDQDDVWFPEKIEWSLATLQRLEAERGAEIPLLVHTDMAVVAEDKTLLATSFWECRHFDPYQAYQAYLLDNPVSGCASLFNRSAAEWAFPLPAEAMQHDRWLALVCAWFGAVEVIPQPLMFYRQHAQNEVGAQGAQWRNHRTHDRIQAWSRQAEAFLKQFGERMSADDRRWVSALAELRHLTGWQRRRQIVQHRLFKQGLLPNLALLLFA